MKLHITFLHVVRSVPGSEGGPSVPREWLRCFLRLKLVTALLLPRGAALPLLLGSLLSLRALLLLRSPRISTKPSTVFLGQLAVADGLVGLHWGLRACEQMLRWLDTTREDGLSQQLLEAHHLATLLLLGLVGLEAVMVSRWPRQTRRFRTSHSAQLSCGLVWALVLLELLVLMPSKPPGSSAPKDPLTPSLTPVPPSVLPSFSYVLRRTLWFSNVCLHYAVIFSKPQRRTSSFH